MKSLIKIIFASIIFISCNGGKNDKENNPIAIYKLIGNEYPKINGFKIEINGDFYKDSIYYGEMNVDFKSKKIIDTLTVNDSLVSNYSYLYTQTFNLDDEIPLDIEEYNIDEEMNVFIPEKQGDKSIPMLFNFKNKGKKKQVYILHDILYYPINKEGSLRLIEQFSIFIDTLTVK